MADEVNAAEREAKADAAFGEGFGDTPPAPAAKVVEETKAEPAKPEATPAKPPAKPEYVRLTKQEWANTKAAAGKVSSLESQVAKLMGSAPNADRIAQQVLEKLQAQTPAGAPIKLTKEDLAELSEDFPELSDKLLAGLGRAFERASVKGTGPAETAQPAADKDKSPAQPVDVDAAVEKVLLKREATALEEAHPDWGDIVGRPIGDGPPRDTPFRAWLAKKPAEYQKKVAETNSPAVVQAAIDDFKASTATSATPRPDKGAVRRAVIEDAVTPRADGNPPPLNQPQSVDDAFAEGFKTGKPH